MNVEGGDSQWQFRLPEQVRERLDNNELKISDDGLVVTQGGRVVTYVDDVKNNFFTHLSRTVINEEQRENSRGWAKSYQEYKINKKELFRRTNREQATYFLNTVNSYANNNFGNLAYRDVVFALASLHKIRPDVFEQFLNMHEEKLYHEDLEQVRTDVMVKLVEKDMDANSPAPMEFFYDQILDKKLKQAVKNNDETLVNSLLYPLGFELTEDDQPPPTIRTTDPRVKPDEKILPADEESLEGAVGGEPAELDSTLLRIVNEISNEGWHSPGDLYRALTDDQKMVFRESPLVKEFLGEKYDRFFREFDPKNPVIPKKNSELQNPVKRRHENAQTTMAEKPEAISQHLVSKVAGEILSGGLNNAKLLYSKLNRAERQAVLQSVRFCAGEDYDNFFRELDPP